MLESVESVLSQPAHCSFAVAHSPPPLFVHSARILPHHVQNHSLLLVAHHTHLHGSSHTHPHGASHTYPLVLLKPIPFHPFHPLPSVQSRPIPSHFKPRCSSSSSSSANAQKALWRRIPMVAYEFTSPAHQLIGPILSPKVASQYSSAHPFSKPIQASCSSVHPSQNPRYQPSWSNGLIAYYSGCVDLMNGNLRPSGPC